MALKCNSCGGLLTYDIDKKDLVCEFCSNRVDVKKYQGKNDAQWAGVFICNSCGAQLCGPQEQVVAYCNYCGSESLELSKMEMADKPKRIAPFKFNKTVAREKYKEAISKKLFVPKEFQDEEFLSEFRGIYIPYWSTTVNLDHNTFHLDGLKTYTTGGYDYREEYDITVEVGGRVNGGYYDASVAFDDTVSEDIAPFNYRTEPFNTGYLAGFYADACTSDREKYRPVAEAHAKNFVVEKIKMLSHGASVNESDIEDNVCFGKGQIGDVSYFPIWFLTWRKGKRVAYSVMNGQTGKLHIDLPLDYKRFFLCAFVQMLVYFVIASILPVFYVPVQLTSLISMALYLTTVLFEREMVKIRQREQHVFDIGDETHTRWKKGKRGVLMNVFIIFLWVLWWLMIGFLGLSAASTETPDDTKFFIGLFGLLQLISVIKAIYNISGIGNKVGLLPLLLGLGAQLVGFVLAGANHPHDYWYYGIAVLMTAAMIIIMFTAIGYINYLTTRPVPNFFTREGAKHE